MENKQTAVEWLIEQIESGKITMYINGDRNKLISIVQDNLIEQAKKMEKQQIIDAFGVGCHHESKRLVGYQDVAEQYYDETYGK